jgi:hypothetical protein
MPRKTRRLSSQTGGEIIVRQGALYDTELNRRYLVRGEPKRVCYFDEHTREASVYDMVSGKLDEELSKKAQRLAGKAEHVFMGEMEKLSIPVIRGEQQIGCHLFNTEDIAALLVLLNESLKLRCPNMRLSFDNRNELAGELHTYSEDDMTTLCLYNGSQCISSVMISPVDEMAIELFSFTEAKHQGRGYNKFLLATTILICAALVCGSVRFKYLNALAINKISAHTLIKEFSVSVTNPEFKITGDTVRDIKAVDVHYKNPDNDPLNIMVDIHANLPKAMELFNKVLSPEFRCA